MKPASCNTQVVGNIGLYYVCYRLSCQGWNVMPTSRNARGVDIVIYSQDGRGKLAIQVKALSAERAVPWGGSVDCFFGDWVIICTNAASQKPLCFILEPEEVRDLVLRSEEHTSELQSRFGI